MCDLGIKSCPECEKGKRVGRPRSCTPRDRFCGPYNIAIAIIVGAVPLGIGAESSSPLAPSISLAIVVVIIFIIFFFLFSTVVAVAVEQQHGFDAALVVVRGAPLCAKAEFDEREVEVNVKIII